MYFSVSTLADRGLWVRPINFSRKMLLRREHLQAFKIDIEQNVKQNVNILGQRTCIEHCSISPHFILFITTTGITI